MDEVPFVLDVAGVTDNLCGRCAVELGVDVATGCLRCGMRDGVVSSVLSNDRFDPCLDGGFEPWRLAGLEFGFEPALDPPGVIPVRGAYDTFLCGVYLPDGPVRPPSLSLKESGVDADSDEREGRDIGIERMDRSRTFMMGPWPLIYAGVLDPFGVAEVGVDRRGVNAAIVCDTPSAKINCSRSSMLVRPLARQGSFFCKNSSNATQPPPTRTITVLRRMRTSRSFCESPNLYLPSPTWKTRNFCRHVQSITKRLTSS